MFLVPRSGYLLVIPRRFRNLKASHCWAKSYLLIEVNEMAETVKKTKAPAKAKSLKAAAELRAPEPEDAKAAKIVKKATSGGAPKPRAKAAKAVAADPMPAATASAATSGLRAVPKRAAIGKQETPAPSREQIAQLAHRFWKERGGHHGAHEQDWFRAERELRGMAS
jgi:hypothetical protein